MFCLFGGLQGGWWWRFLSYACDLWDECKRAGPLRRVSQARLLHGKLSAQSAVYYVNMEVMRKVFREGYGASGLPLAVTEDQLGNAWRSCFLYCDTSTGAVRDQQQAVRTAAAVEAAIHLPPNLTVYRQERGVQLVKGAALYFCYAARLHDQACVNLVATERELNAGVTSDWSTYVRVKLTNVKRTYGFLEARRWLQAYQTYFELPFIGTWELTRL